MGWIRQSLASLKLDIRNLNLCNIVSVREDRRLGRGMRALVFLVSLRCPRSVGKDRRHIVDWLTLQTWVTI